MVVVDASAVLDLLLAPSRALALCRRLLSDPSWHAPHLVDLEVTQTLRRSERSGRLSARRAAEALDLLSALPLTRWPHMPFLPRIWRLRRNLTAYDASYIALAEALDVSLVTSDRRMGGAPGHRARVEVFA